jgi:hypothetical protein
MRVISTKIHSIQNYMSGILLMASPWIFGFDQVSAARWVTIVVGLALLLMSLLTNYEGGVLKSIPMAVHLNTDVVAGLFLAASPWLLGFHDQVYLPHLILGIFEIAAGLMTSRIPAGQSVTDIKHL